MVGGGSGAIEKVCVCVCVCLVWWTRKVVQSGAPGHDFLASKKILIMADVDRVYAVKIYIDSYLYACEVS